MGFLILRQIFFNYLNTESAEVYTWGWKECIPSGKVFGDPSMGGTSEKDIPQSSFLTEQGTHIITFQGRGNLYVLQLM